MTSKLPVCFVLIGCLFRLLAEARGAESERVPAFVAYRHRTADAVHRVVSMLAALATLAAAGLLAPPGATLTYPVVLSSENTYPSACRDLHSGATLHR